MDVRLVLPEIEMPPGMGAVVMDMDARLAACAAGRQDRTTNMAYVDVDFLAFRFEIEGTDFPVFA